MIEIKTRFKLIRKAMGLSQEELAKTLDTARSYIGDIENAKFTKGISFALAQKLCSKCNASIDWLITGNGSMFITSEDEVLNNAIQTLNIIARSKILTIDEKITFFESLDNLANLIVKDRS